jgi:hypothetical protein
MRYLPCGPCPDGCGGAGAVVFVGAADGLCVALAAGVGVDGTLAPSSLAAASSGSTTTAAAAASSVSTGADFTSHTVAARTPIVTTIKNTAIDPPTMSGNFHLSRGVGGALACGALAIAAGGAAAIAAVAGAGGDGEATGAATGKTIGASFAVMSCCAAPDDDGGPGGPDRSVVSGRVGSELATPSTAVGTSDPRGLPTVGASLGAGSRATSALRCDAGVSTDAASGLAALASIAGTLDASELGCALRAARTSACIAVASG